MVLKERSVLLDQIDSLALSPRQSWLRDKYFSSQSGMSAELASLATQSWQETEGQPLDLRRAKQLKKICEGITIDIFAGQRLLGSLTTHFRWAFPHVDFDVAYLKPILKEEAAAGPVDRGAITPEDRAILAKCYQYWQGRTPADRVTEQVQQMMGSWYDDIVKAGVLEFDRHAFDAMCPLFNRVVEVGLRAHIEEAERHIQAFIDNGEHDLAKLYFWQASIIACQSAITLARRFAQKARAMAAVETDGDERAQLEEIANICEWVPEHPARTFREGLQSVVLAHTALSLENPLPPVGWARMDRYLYPLFSRDLTEGRLTLAEAGDLIAEFYTHCLRQEWVFTKQFREFVHKAGAYSSVALGGTYENGDDVSNELTYLFLHAMGLMRYPEPHLALGWHKGMAPWLMRKAMETACKTGGGVPQFQNCDHFVDYMVRRGVSIENARNWISHGCSQINSGDQSVGLSHSYPNVALYVDLALHNGVASFTGKRIGTETGDPRTFQTFEDFYRAFQIQSEYMIKKQLWHDEMTDWLKGQHYRQPLASTLLPGPLQKGMDFALGGLHSYRMTFKKDRGHVPAGDSLIAIKRLVYEEKKFTMEELLHAIDSNFAGERGEEIRRMCLAAPKYGNDIDEADNMVRDVAEFTGNVILSGKNIWGCNYAINRNGEAWHYMVGKCLAALPNGRRVGEPLADGSLSPMQGMDWNGPTAILNSALKANFKEQSAAGIMTIKFSPGLLATPQARDKATALTETFLRSGGTYIQYNILDPDELKEAKLHPEKYADLMVRVAGFSAYFVELAPELQDEIIQRTEHIL